MLFVFVCEGGGYGVIVCKQTELWTVGLLEDHPSLKKSYLAVLDGLVCWCQMFGLNICSSQIDAFAYRLSESFQLLVKTDIIIAELIRADIQQHFSPR